MKADWLIHLMPLVQGLARREGSVTSDADVLTAATALREPPQPACPGRPRHPSLAHSVMLPNAATPEHAQPSFA